MRYQGNVPAFETIVAYVVSIKDKYIAEQDHRETINEICFMLFATISTLTARVTKLDSIHEDYY